MKKLALLILAAVAALPLAASAADANAYAEVLSAYVYRGQIGNDEAVFQPGLNVDGPLGLGYSFWGSMNLTDVESSWYPDSAGEWGEVDLGLSWAVPLKGPVGFSVGGIYFIYPQNASEVAVDEETGAPILDAEGNAQVSKAPADGSYEVFVEAAAEDVPLAPTLRFCHDLDNTDDWIAMLSISHSFDLIEKLSLALGAGIGYAGDFYVADNYGGSDAGDAFTHAQLDAGLNYAFTEAFSLGLKGSFCTLVDEDVRDDVDESAVYPETEIFSGGVTASYSF